MIYQSWVTFFSILVSGTMLFTLASTVVLYTKYKLGQTVALPQPMVARQTFAEAPLKEKATSPSLSLHDAVAALQNAQAQRKSEAAPFKRKISLGQTFSTNES